MGESLIVRKGGGGAKVALPTITEVEIGADFYTFTITNNDSASALITYELEDNTPDETTIELAGNATSSNITLSGLSGLTTYNLSAFATVIGKTTSDVVTEEFTTVLLIDQGLIVAYYGASNTIPATWFLCNGTNGTPNLTDKFIVGAGSTYAVNATGGTTDRTMLAHTHTGTFNTTGAHTHSVSVGSSMNFGSAFERPQSSPNNAYQLGDGGQHQHSWSVNSSGSAVADTNLPPYYGLFYIMKGPNV